jgi:hypothetical protein
VAEQVMAQAKAAVKWPAGGQYIGDWREGEKLAQNGRGMTWTDKSAAAKANGGSCYNCHQISKQEISFGTIGPSLYNYGKNRGVTDVTSPTPGHRRVHLDEDLQRQDLQRLLQHAAFRPPGPAGRKADGAPDGLAAGPEVAGQPVGPCSPAWRSPPAGLFQHQNISSYLS